MADLPDAAVAIMFSGVAPGSGPPLPSDEGGHAPISERGQLQSFFRKTLEAIEDAEDKEQARKQFFAASGN